MWGICDENIPPQQIGGPVSTLGRQKDYRQWLDWGHGRYTGLALGDVRWWATVYDRDPEEKGMKPVNMEPGNGSILCAQVLGVEASHQKTGLVF